LNPFNLGDESSEILRSNTSTNRNFGFIRTIRPTSTKKQLFENSKPPKEPLDILSTPETTEKGVGNLKLEQLNKAAKSIQEFEYINMVHI
jgi:hypothetical protein